MSKKFSVQHFYANGIQLDYIMLPLGAKMNAELKAAKSGDKLCFLDGETADIYQSIVLPMRDSVAGALCVSKYSRSLSVVYRQWCENAMYLGNGRNAVDPDNCLVVFYHRNSVKR